MIGRKLSLDQIEKQRTWVRRINRVLLLTVPFLVLALGVEAAQWAAAERGRPVPAQQPELASLDQPLLPIPELKLSADRFPAKKAESPTAPAPGGSSQVAVQEISWKLLGVVMTPVKKAYLENSASKQTVSVSEGDRLGDIEVQRIEERTVVLEREGQTYEIRL